MYNVLQESKLNNKYPFSYPHSTNSAAFLLPPKSSKLNVKYFF